MKPNSYSSYRWSCALWRDALSHQIFLNYIRLLEPLKIRPLIHSPPVADALCAISPCFGFLALDASQSLSFNELRVILLLSRKRSLRIRVVVIIEVYLSKLLVLLNLLSVWRHLSLSRSHLVFWHVVLLILVISWVCVGRKVIWSRRVILWLLVLGMVVLRLNGLWERLVLWKPSVNWYLGLLLAFGAVWENVNFC